MKWNLLDASSSVLYFPQTEHFKDNDALSSLVTSNRNMSCRNAKRHSLPAYFIIASPGMKMHQNADADYIDYNVNCLFLPPNTAVNKLFYTMNVHSFRQIDYSISQIDHKWVSGSTVFGQTTE